MCRTVGGIKLVVIFFCNFISAYRSIGRTIFNPQDEQSRLSNNVGQKEYLFSTLKTFIYIYIYIYICQSESTTKTDSK